MFKKTVIALAFAADLPATQVLAGSDPVLTDEIANQIRETLTQQGYEVAKIKTEDGLFEAYAKTDGKKFEVFLNEKMEIVRTKED